MVETVLGTLEDGVATLILNRPEVGNALDLETIERFTAMIASLAAEGSVRAWLVRTAGPAFCTGGDIKEFAAAADPAALIRNTATILHRGLEMLQSHRAPVIVAVQGVAAGAGLALAAGADIVLAGRKASFLWAYSQVALTCDAGASWHLPRLVGMRRAQEMAYTGRRVTAEEAEAFGLITRLVDDASLQEEAESLAAKVARGPTSAFGEVKRLFAASHANDFKTQLDLELESVAAAMNRPDTRNAIRDLLAKRTPDFSGS